jgi:FkbM family methyltransferase
MARGAYLAGRAIDAALAVAERLSPSAALRLKRQFYRPDMSVGLRLLKADGFSPAAAVDVGAFEGEWSRLCRAIFPEVHVLMVEAGQARAAALAARCADDARLQVRHALLGSGVMSVRFREQASNSGVVNDASEDAVSMTTVTLDDVLTHGPFAGPALLKLDVQGFELEVLKGALATLATVEVLIVELSLIQLHAVAPDALDVQQWLARQGFRLFDICGFIRRPVDGALWQIDAIFVKRTSRFGDASRGW